MQSTMNISCTCTHGGGGHAERCARASAPADSRETTEMSAQARRGYEGYAKSTGGKTFDGRQMPTWDELPNRIKEAWREAVAAAVDKPSPKETMTDVQVRLLDEMGTAEIGKRLAVMLPPDRGFILLTASFGNGGNIAYISNIDRDDSIRIVREWLKRQAGLSTAEVESNDDGDGK
jgi:hypothetical protein